jgi:hypothetical protein
MIGLSGERGLCEGVGAMKYDPIPVTPEVIRWARVRAGFSLEDISEKFKDIEAWEAGEAFPSYPQL